MRTILHSFIFLVSLFFLSNTAFGQCLTISVSNTDVSCYGGNDGQVIVDIVDGVAPFTYELYIFQPGSGSTKLGEVNTSATNVIFQKGNGTLISGAESFGIPANETVSPGSEYRVTISSSSGGGYVCDVKTGSTTVLQPPAMTSSESISDNTSCNVPNGAIDITPSGGTSPYTFAWTADNGFTSTSEDISGLAGGDYTVEMTDSQNCVRIAGPFTLNDPTPTTYNITNGTPQQVCLGNDIDIILDNTDPAPPAPEPPVIYEIYVNGAGTGVTRTGDGSSNFVITLPSAEFVHGDVVQVHATQGNCTPVFMNGSVTIEAVNPPTANAGSDEEVCEGLAFDFNSQVTSATATEYATVSWTHTGAGTLANATTLTPTYTPGAGETGAITFTLTAAGQADCADASDDMILNITPAPTANAGSNEEVCSTQVFDFTTQTTAATATNQSSLLWTHNGAGVIANGTTLTPTYTPDATDAGNVITFTLTASGNGSCADAVSTMELTITPAPTAEAGSDEEVCEGDDLDLSGSATAPSATNYSSLLWSTSGDGTFNDSSLEAPVYTPGITDITNGTVTLTIEATGNGSCMPATDDMLLTITPAPIANAGSDEAVCEGDDFDLSTSATAPSGTNYSSLLWSTSGDGTFNDTSLETPVYTPGTTDLTNGTVTLTMEAMGNGSCAAATDDMLLTITPAPTANAGSDEAICEGNNFDLSTSATPPVATNYSSLLWSTSGDGTFDNTSLLAPVYTPGATDITNGAVTLTIEATGNGSCMPATDDMLLTITPAPIVNAGSDEAVCEGDNFDLSTSATLPTASNYSSLLWSTSGDGTFSDASLETPVYTPGPTDLTNGSVTLTFEATGNGSCAAATDNMLLTITPAPTANAGSDEEICEGDDLDLSLSTTPPTASGYSTLLWSSSGDGTFSDNTLLEPVYTPGAADITSGTVSLTLQASGNGTCAPAVDDMILTLTSSPTANAGSDEGICEGDDLDLSVSATQPTAANFSSLLWSTSGDGSFNDATILKPVYTPGTADMSSGSVTLTLEALPNGSCTAATDDMVLTISPAPAEFTVSGGGSYCEGNPQSYDITLSGSNIGVDYILLLNGADIATEAGTGAAITYSAQTSSGIYTVRAQDTGSGCSAPMDGNAAIIRLFRPTAQLSGDNTICGGSTEIVFDLTGTAPWSIEYTDGTSNYTISDINVPKFAIDVAPTVSTTYSPIAVTDAYCTGTVSGDAEIAVVSNLNADLTVVANPASACNGESVDIEIEGSESGVNYQLRNDADDTEIGGPVAGNGGLITLPTGSLTTNITFNVFATSNSCTSTELTNKATVNVLASSDPACSTGGGGGGGTGECATVVISFPAGYITPATCTNSDGEIIFKIDPFVPAENNTGVTIDIDGPVKRTNLNDSIFSNLPFGVYDYTIEYGDPSCIKTGTVTIDQSGSVGTPQASDIVRPSCFGGAGSVKLDVSGETGNDLQYKIGSIWKTFVAGDRIEVPAGPAPSYEQVISVRRSKDDLCNAAVTVVMESVYEEIKITSSTTEASCDNNDGSIIIKSVTGGSQTFTYRLDGIPYENLPDMGVFDELAGGEHLFTVIDEGAGGCEESFNIIVPYPGLVNFSTYPKNPDCSSNAASNGEIEVVIYSIGQFQVGISTDHTADPAEYYNVASDGSGSFTFSDLERGNYYITVVSTGATCPNRRKVEIAGGPAAVSFDYEMGCLDDDMNKDIRLLNITGAATEDYELRVFKRQNDLTFQQVASIAVPPNSEEFLIRNPTMFAENAEFKFTLAQLPPECPTEELVYEHPETVIVPTAFTAEVDTTTTSLPDPATGTIVINKFSGGSPIYYTNIFLKGGFEDDFQPVSRNEKGQYEMVYEGVAAGEYIVEIRDELGCLIPPIEAIVPLNREVWIPNIFTPNGDPKNQTFFIRNLADADAKLIVTNRWGSEIFRSESYDNNWAAEGVPDGVYFYKLDNAGNGVYTGWVEILRGKP